MKKQLFNLLVFLGLFLISYQVHAANIPKIKNIRIRQITSDGSSGLSCKIVVIVKHEDNDEVANVESDIVPVSDNKDNSMDCLSSLAVDMKCN